MTWRAHITSVFRRVANRLNPKPDKTLLELGLRPVQMKDVGAKDPFSPGPELLKAVRIGFIRQGTTMNAWCGARRINRGNATIALLGGWRGPKGRAIARRVAKAAGVGEIRWNQ